jgi:hypothetical protein
MLALFVPCFTGLSLPPSSKTLHREREPMGLHQKDNKNEMTLKNKNKIKDK